MKVVAHVHRGVPAHGAGAEWYLHSVLSDLVRRGHECVVLFPRTHDYELDGVRYLCDPQGRRKAWTGADVALTHLDQTRTAIRMSRETGVPLVHLVHNDRQLRHHRVQPKDAPLVVFNSWWLAREYEKWWPGAHMVLPPPVFAEDYRTTPGDCITLVNLTEAKGAPLFWKLAEVMPDRPFLAAKGAYGVQIIPDPVPPNVTVIDNTGNARDDIYARTRVLLMPSSYESWGRCAIEAAASGIPTIAHPTPGLVESLDYAGVFALREVLQEWLRHLELLDDPAHYAAMSQLVLTRSAELDPTADLDLLETALLDLAAQPRRRRGSARG